MNEVKKPPKPAVREWRIFSEDTLAHSEAFFFVIKQFFEHLRDGFGDAELPFYNACNVVYAKLGEEVIGAAVWVADAQKRAAWIYFSAVDQEHRRKGVYSSLCAEVERLAKLKKCVALYSGVHVNNDAMINASVKSGRSADWYRMKKDLK